MRNLRARLDKLLRARGGGGWELDTELSDAEVMNGLCAMFGLQPGSVSTTAQEASDKGYTCVLDEFLSKAAAALGKSPAEVKSAIDKARERYESDHEWRWIDGKCYVRPRPGAPDIDVQLEGFLHGFTDDEVARLGACIGVGPSPKSSESFDAVWLELCQARAARSEQGVNHAGATG